MEADTNKLNAVDPRGDLLDEIRKGVELKAVILTSLWNYKIEKLEIIDFSPSLWE